MSLKIKVYQLLFTQIIYILIIQYLIKKTFRVKVCIRFCQSNSYLKFKNAYNLL
jgi:hypothetical protein